MVPLQGVNSPSLRVYWHPFESAGSRLQYFFHLQSRLFLFVGFHRLQHPSDPWPPTSTCFVFSALSSGTHLDWSWQNHFINDFGHAVTGKKKRTTLNVSYLYIYTPIFFYYICICSFLPLIAMVPTMFCKSTSQGKSEVLCPSFPPRHLEKLKDDRWQRHLRSRHKTSRNLLGGGLVIVLLGGGLAFKREPRNAVKSLYFYITRACASTQTKLTVTFDAKSI